MTRLTLLMLENWLRPELSKMFSYVLISSLIVSLLAFIGILFLSVNKNLLEKILFILIAFAAGAMLGNAFFHIMPEALESMEPLMFSILLMTGFALFFVLEKGLYWHHCHKTGKHEEHGHKKNFGILNLIGDGVHNLLDGVLIAVGYIVSIPVGIATTIAVITHEVPQEIGDFGILIYSGFSRKKALLLNFLSALFAVVGAVLGWFILKDAEFVEILLPIVAGSFLYIAASDLIPELSKEEKPGKAFLALVFFVLGLVVLYFATSLLGH